MNETGWAKQSQTRRVVSRTGGARPHQKKLHTYDHITSVHTIAASGKNLPTLIIFKKTVPNFTDGDYPSNLFITSSDTGFINSQIFLQYLKDIVIPYRQTVNGPFLLTMDNASPHISFEIVMLCIIHAIEIFSFLPNASGYLQPLDQIFGTLKYQAYEVARNLSYSVAGFITNKKKFPYILHMATQIAFTSDLIKSSFRRTGIFPFNPSAVEMTNVRQKKKTKNSEVPEHDNTENSEPCKECGRREPCKTCMSNANPLAKDHLLKDPLMKAMLLPPPIPPPLRKMSTPKARHLTGMHKSTTYIQYTCGLLKGAKVTYDTTSPVNLAEKGCWSQTATKIFNCHAFLQSTLNIIVF